MSPQESDRTKKSERKLRKVSFGEENFKAAISRYLFLLTLNLKLNGGVLEPISSGRMKTKNRTWTVLVQTGADTIYIYIKRLCLSVQ